MVEQYLKLNVFNELITEPTEPQGRTAISKEEPIELDGEIVDVLGNSNFRVQVSENHDVLAKIAGRMRRHRIRIFEGDRVKVEVSPYDLNRGRIVWRYS